MNLKKAMQLILYSALLVPASHALEGNYKLVWADEFNVEGVPSSVNWTYEHGFVRNSELQWYQSENATCTNGMLVIEGHRERVPNTDHKPGSNSWRNRGKFAEYTSACLTTQGLHRWKYGRFEMRAKIDVRPGLWPAFWTLGIEGEWPGNGEIDIMEYYQGQLLANVGCASQERFAPKWDSVKTPVSSFPKDWANLFHIWRMDWDEESIKLYVDDRLLNETKLADTFNPDGHSVKNPFRQPHYILVNLAIGGKCGGDPSETQFPSRYEIDYISVYQKQELN